MPIQAIQRHYFAGRSFVNSSSSGVPRGGASSSSIGQNSSAESVHQPGGFSASWLLKPMPFFSYSRTLSLTQSCLQETHSSQQCPTHMSQLQLTTADAPHPMCVIFV